MGSLDWTLRKYYRYRKSVANMGLRSSAIFQSSFDVRRLRDDSAFLQQIGHLRILSGCVVRKIESRVHSVLPRARVKIVMAQLAGES